MSSMRYVYGAFFYSEFYIYSDWQPDFLKEPHETFA